MKQLRKTLNAHSAAFTGLAVIALGLSACALTWFCRAPAKARARSPERAAHKAVKAKKPARTP